MNVDGDEDVNGCNSMKKRGIKKRIAWSCSSRPSQGVTKRVALCFFIGSCFSRTHKLTMGGRAIAIICLPFLV
jgi:hypothetical protein